MAFSGMLHRVTLARTDVSEELNASIIRVMEASSSSETSVFTRVTRGNIPEDAFFIVTSVKPQILHDGNSSDTMGLLWTEL
jgi:hypothetical protein